MSLTSDKTCDTRQMEVIRTALEPKAAELGLELSVWDAEGQMLPASQASNEFCRFVCASCRQCHSKRAELVQYVLNDGQPSRATGTLGCCLVGIPVFNRRRLIGAVILGYPTRQMGDQESLARLCHTLKLDAQAMAKIAEQSCRHDAVEAPHFLELFSRLLIEQQAANEADNALQSLSTNLASRYEELNLLYHISGSMKVSSQPQEFLQDVCDRILDVMDMEIAAAVVYDVRTHMGEDIIVHTGEDVDTQQLRLLAAIYIVPRLLVPGDLLLENAFDKKHDLYLKGRLDHLIAAPLTIDRKNIGMLFGINKRGQDFDSFDIKLLSSIAGQSSVFLANHRMYAELQDLLMGVLQSLTESIDAKDPYTCGHSRRVAAISKRMAEDMGFDAARTRQVYLAGLLHDVGKIGIPEAILCKDGRLTDDEYNNIKRHPEIGAKILRRIRNLEPIIAGVLSHHERLDGKGYPHGLSGGDIPLEGKIIGLADSWDAMTSHRTYRRGLSLELAVKELQDCAGSQFDPRLVEIFLSWDLEAFTKELHTANTNDPHLLDEQIP
ncbi:MAG: HD domain-containing protein [Phycisphaerae bacterium]|nr:HD domain-containing protein [Phycisphaerae bacterium]